MDGVEPTGEAVNALREELGLNDPVYIQYLRWLWNNFALTPYTLMTGDPDFFVGGWIYSQGQINKRRGIGYSNSEADRLIEDACAEGDGSLRQIYYAGLQELVARDVPLCPLFHDVCLYATKKEVRDLTIDPFFKPSLDKAWVEQ